MADNVLDSGAPSAKRPKLSSPALSVSASDGNGKYFNAFLILIYIKWLALSFVCSFLVSIGSHWSCTDLKMCVCVWAAQ